MKLTVRLVENLQLIAQGKTIPYTAFPKSLREQLIEEGLLTVVANGSRRGLRTGNPKAFLSAIPMYNEALRDLDAAKSLLIEDSSRSSQASISGNSKTIVERSCPGFLVNAYEQMICMLNDSAFTIGPKDGSAIYIANWKSFVPPKSALIIGIENMENFLKIRNQRELFRSMLLPGETQTLFVARYALSSDLVHWLKDIPNRYLHFGDFDLAGIDIFLSQFSPYVGNRGSFLIPSDIEQRIMNGSRKRYDDQYAKYSTLKSTDDTLQSLIDLIHHYRRTYDQEGYIDELNEA